MTNRILFEELLKAYEMKSDSSKIASYDNASTVKNTIISISTAKLLSYATRAQKNIARAIAISTSLISTKDATHVKIANTSRELRIVK
jgi:2C-methyl-D-erythritol 2,4-cyclodiphosphate synthase